MKTPLSDYVAGRIWEYSWQFLFTGQGISCLAEHICYCDGFGVCFGGAAEYKEFENVRSTSTGFQEELTAMQQRAGVQTANAGRHLVNGSTGISLDPGRYSYLNSQITALDMEVGARKQAALERGLSPENRARECGRSWREADDGL